LSNTLLTPKMIGNETLMVLENTLTFGKQINRQYSDKFARTGAKIGSSVDIRKPVRHIVQSGPNLSAQDVTETSVTLNLLQQKHVDFQFPSVELTLSVDEFSDRYLKTGAAALANAIDVYMLQLAYQSTYQAVGTPGTVPTDEGRLRRRGR
jgi:hypothetical protein